ncbi:hypothetical protein OBP_148 [Pseudomonas phage OBP]|uniref:hypothetical protein n=1 Tax=Pseudomonas phage OBP TaxID=1124849 RepID=UPI000240D569|nr:hypothetical protein OBP_148 [Pseudomonas phage OBP]AEV89585.1 hypothetical protein OBP_148 [Pseudomonas phage OBP]
MQKLFPIANRNTRHLFIDPLLSKPSFVAGEGYVSGEMTSFIKPGKVPNLAELCRPEDVKFTVTEEPDPTTMGISEIMFGMYDENKEWRVVSVTDLDIPFVADGPARSTIDGCMAVQHPFKEKGMVNIPISLLYERGTRALTFKEVPNVGYDSGVPQILGIKLNLDWRDAKIV